MPTNRDVLEDATASEKLILFVLLERGEPVPSKELVDETRLPPSTVRNKTKDLVDAGVIERGHVLQDLRQRQFSIADGVAGGAHGD